MKRIAMLIGVLLACALLGRLESRHLLIEHPAPGSVEHRRVQSPPSKPELSIGGIRPGMTESEVLKALGTPVSGGSIPTGFTLAEYPQVTVYYRERRVFNVRGPVLERAGRPWVRSGELWRDARKRLGTASERDPPECFCVGCLPKSLVYLPDLEVYLDSYRGDGEEGWRKATIRFFELGRRVTVL